MHQYDGWVESKKPIAGHDSWAISYSAPYGIMDMSDLLIVWLGRYDNEWVQVAIPMEELFKDNEKIFPIIRANCISLIKRYVKGKDAYDKDYSIYEIFETNFLDQLTDNVLNYISVHNLKEKYNAKTEI